VGYPAGLSGERSVIAIGIEPLGIKESHCHEAKRQRHKNHGCQTAE
jgi:hypothetical protein